MRNHQGVSDPYNFNENIQSETNCQESIEALGFLSSSSSHIGSAQSFPNRLSEPNFLPNQEDVNIVASHDCGAGVLRRNLDLNAEYVENNHDTSQNVSVGLSLYPFKPDGPDSDSNSDLMAVDSGSPNVVDEQGMDSSSVDMSFLSCNRSPEHACRELLIGESSSTAMQAGVPISLAATSQVNACNSLNISAPYNGPANIHQQQFDAGIGHGAIRSVSNMQQFNEARHGSANIFPVSFEAGIGHGIARPVYDMHHLSHARQTGRFQTNIHSQTAANPQAFVPSSISSMGHTSSSHVRLPSQIPWYHQHDYPPFYSPAQASVGTIPYVQPFVQVSSFHESLQASPWDNMGPRNVPPPFSPVYTVTQGGTVEYFYHPINIPRNIMFGPQTGRGVQAHNLANLNFHYGYADFPGNFASPSHYGSFSGSHLSNVPTLVPGFNVSEQQMHMLSGVGNHSAAASIGFTGQTSHNPLDLNPSAVSQEMDLTTGFGNSRSQNQHRTVSRSVNLFDLNLGPPYTAEVRENLLNEVQNTLEHLRNGGSMRVEDLLILDYTLLLFLLEDRNNDEEDDEENEENRQSVAGLNEEDILMHLRREQFQSSTVETPENVESCCICQENYANGEDIGVLNCRHKFHFGCIKQWLQIKNTCPICVQRGLAV